MSLPDDWALRPLKRIASRRSLREARRKVWHNALELQRARAGPEAWVVGLGELELLSAARSSTSSPWAQRSFG